MKSTQSKTAILVKKLDHMRGDAAIYRLNPPVESREDGAIEYVTVSAVDLMVDGFDVGGGMRTSETMIFPSDGESTTDWGELAMVPHKSHADALADLGYTIA